MKITTIEQANLYVNTVLRNSSHHAQDVKYAAYAMMGVLIADSQEVRVATRNGVVGNVCWATIDNTRYALSYNHNTHSIEIRVGSIRGEVLASINNHTPLPTICTLFEKVLQETYV